MLIVIRLIFGMCVSFTVYFGFTQDEVPTQDPGNCCPRCQARKYDQSQLGPSLLHSQCLIPVQINWVKSRSKCVSCVPCNTESPEAQECVIINYFA